MADERIYPRTEGDQEAEAAAAQYAAEHGLAGPETLNPEKQAEVKEIGGEGIEAAQRLVHIPVELGHIEGTDIAVIDKRSTNPQRVEAEFQAEKTAEEERLSAPLNHEEHVKLIDSLQGVATAALKQAEEKGSELPRQQVEDLRGDSYAVSRLKQLLEGKSVLSPEFKPDATNPAAIAEVLNRVVDSLAHARTFTPDGTIHFEGYDGANLYQFVRAKQLWEDINEADPKAIRQGALEAKEGADWVTNMLLADPVKFPYTQPAPEQA